MISWGPFAMTQWSVPMPRRSKRYDYNHCWGSLWWLWHSHLDLQRHCMKATEKSSTRNLVVEVTAVSDSLENYLIGRRRMIKFNLHSESHHTSDQVWLSGHHRVVWRQQREGRRGEEEGEECKSLWVSALGARSRWKRHVRWVIWSASSDIPETSTRRQFDLFPTKESLFCLSEKGGQRRRLHF